jgi:hypothetical protein
MALASGNTTNLIYWRERVPGVQPAALTTASTSLDFADGDDDDSFKVTRAAGSFITDGFVDGQLVNLASFGATGGTPTEPAGVYRIRSVVDATTVILEDTTSTVTLGGGTSDGSGTMQIKAQTLRVTSMNINLERNLLESGEIRSSGMQSDVRHGFNQISGSLGFELSRAAFDDWMEAALRGRFTTVSGAKTSTETVSVGAGIAGTATFTRSGGSWIDNGFRVGDLVNVASGTLNAANVGQWRILALTTTVMTVEDLTDKAVVESAKDAVEDFTLAGRRLDAGTTKITFGVERQFTDIGQYQVFNGVTAGNFQLSLDPEQIATATVDVIGLSGGDIGGTSIVTGSVLTPQVAPSYSPFAWQDGAVYEGKVSNAVVTGGNVTVNSQRSLEAVVGSRFSPDIFEGTMQVEAQLDAFLETGASLFGKFYDETESSLWLTLVDPSSATEFMSIVVPRTKYTGAQLDPQQEGPITQSLPFRGLEKAVAISGSTGYTSITIQVSNAADVF